MALAAEPYGDLFQLQESRGFSRKIKHLEESNRKLALELEHERGKLAGLGQSNAVLREHNSVLETALAKREAGLVQLNLQVLGPAQCCAHSLGPPAPHSQLQWAESSLPMAESWRDGHCA